jgi:hypothetical protein
MASGSDRRSVRRRGLVAALTCLAALHSVDAQDALSTVVAVDSVSTTRGGEAPRPLRAEDTVAVGAALVFERGGDLLLKCPGKSWRYTCVGKSCMAVACSPTTGTDVRVREWDFPETPSVQAREPKGIAALWARLNERTPRGVVVAAARGLGDPVDAVVLQDSRGVHWAPALSGVLEGSLCLRVERVPASASPPSVVTMQWDRRPDSAISTNPPLSRGLHAVVRGAPAGDGSCRADVNADPAWVLIASESEFPRLSQEWAVHEASVAQLENEGAAPVIVATVRRLVLASLDESMAAN